MLELWVVWWRDVLLLQSGCPDSCNNIDYIDKISALARSIPNEAVRRYLRTLQRIEGYLRHTVNVRMALEVLILSLPQAG